jgi:hypothetical protein
VITLALVKEVVFEHYSPAGPAFRFSRSDIANTLKTTCGVESYDGALDDIDAALFRYTVAASNLALGPVVPVRCGSSVPASRRVRSLSPLPRIDRGEEGEIVGVGCS